MNVPEIRRCFGMFPPKYATYMISLLSLGLGGAGLAAVVIYALVRELIVKHFTGALHTDAMAQKVAILSIGLSSLFLFFSGLFLFVGVVFSNHGSMAAGVWVLTAMCGVLLFVCMILPILCYNDEQFCLMKKFPLAGIIIMYTIVTLYLEVWFYFMVVAHNCLNEM